MACFSVGDAVTLTPAMKAVNVRPEFYERGVVTEPSGAWGVCRVKWNGIDRPIAMRNDEIQLVKEERNV